MTLPSAGHRREDAARESHGHELLVGFDVVVVGVGGEAVDEPLAVGVADHDGRDADAARVAVHDDRRARVVVDDDGDRAGVLGIARS